MIPTLSELKKWYSKNQESILQDYFTFLKFPSISTDPSYRKHINAAAGWVEKYLEKIGFKTQIWQTKFHPVVFATHEVDPKRPTVLIYHHYDVQPIDPIEKWKSPPFEPTVRESKVFARGASDNKGQCFYTLTALKALFEMCGSLNLNIKVFVEGGEECGSQGALEALKTHQKALRADHLLVVDGGFAARDRPAITLGLRGIVTVEVVCRNAKIDLHSGIHGGIALNPNRALVEMLSKLWDKKGKIAIPGFYKNVVKPTAKELKALQKIVDEKYLRKQFGIQAFRGEGGYSLWESNTIRPTLEINGIAGGYSGAGFKTVIPSMAIAKISCRTVPNQDSDEVARSIAAYLKKIAPKGLEVEVTSIHGGKAVRSSPETKVAKVCSDALTEVFGKPCGNILCGASIPLVADLAKACKGDALVIGVSLDSDDIHAPNENFSFDQLQHGFLMMGCILGRFAS
ncbi:MAG TPA: M20/M25/M40 family metallo-hydrolase [Rhabdochlamydiaceae bacterium]|jgi:acetylornithine deacetylase/succinyl-diaminopimelate desuccinylase-like protein|nr:M20/M25/M40 family metallo-hydrolase [Rhabdochlamydiaceae bacterium]